MTAPNVVTLTPTPASSGSAIHDLGYRRYDGPRLDAEGAWRAVYIHTLRTLFGFGRPFKAKVLPVLVMVVSCLPALAAVTAAGVSNGAIPVRYGGTIGPQIALFIVFIAAQAPEVVSRDQQYRVLPLLFTRDVTRVGYATARALGVFTAMFAVSLAPLLLMYVGELGIAKDPAATFTTMWTRLGPVLAHATLTASALTGLGVGIASWFSRRAYATASVFATGILLTAIANGVEDLVGVDEGMANLLDLIRLLQSSAMLLFGETTRAMELTPPPSLAVHALIAGVWGAIGVSVYVWRIRRLRV
jgi:ABC-2 type transport system permease protein